MFSMNYVSQHNSIIDSSAGLIYFNEYVNIDYLTNWFIEKIEHAKMVKVNYTKLNNQISEKILGLMEEK